MADTNLLCSLRDTTVKATLDRLHENAKGDKKLFLALIPKRILGFIQGKGIDEILTVDDAKDMYLPVGEATGQFLYQVARSINARNIVEFGTSFGISTIYLAAAAKDNGGGTVIGTELAPNKHEVATNNLKQAGLLEYTDIRLGDAMETLKTVPEPIDMLLLDGWKNLYIPVFKLLEPKLRKGSIVMADNIHTFKKTLQPYVDYMQSGQNGFESITLNIGSGVEYSVYIGD